MYFLFGEIDFLFLNVFSDRSLNVQYDEEPLFTESDLIIIAYVLGAYCRSGLNSDFRMVLLS